ncbi:MAG: FAD-dependent thymidylate synthase [Candidatus Nanoarchaeia archaeon]|nr:FAD-dependent thymidylate synthase [Candidatus Nanoarchaeia archaeon]
MVLKGINPKVEILGSGPITFVDGKEITAEEIIAFSSMMTYKDASAIDMIREIINSDKNIKEVVLKSLKGSAKRGHASMSTSAGMWLLFNETSKYMDSLLTGATFSSSLMPSSRRIPVNLDNIVAPDSIINADEETRNLYEKISKNNISFYMEIENKAIPREEAAKITQYGIAGGGFIFLSLESILSAKNDFIAQGKWTPKEGNDIIKALEDKMKEEGIMYNLYQFRQEAARYTYPHVNIFTNPTTGSHIKDLQRKNGFPIKPIVELKYLEDSENLEKELRNLLELRNSITESPEKVKQSWKELLKEKNRIISAYKNILNLSSQHNPSWRVWGEIKRHRTLQQEVESVYNAIDRSYEKMNDFKTKLGNLNEGDIKKIDSFLMIPKSFLKEENENLLNRYIQLFSESLDAYKILVSRGIPEADAASLIPRGIRLTVDKRFDLYNILEGYNPLRSCNTAESEMRENTDNEIHEIKKILPKSITDYIGPKCASVGFCLEPKTCGKVQKYINFDYTPEVHKYLSS